MKLRTRISIAAIATAAAAGATGTFLLPDANAHGMTHTLKFTSVQQATTNLSPTTGASEDNDINQTGNVIGYDILRFSFNPKTNTTSIGAAIDLNGGFLYGQMRESEPVTRGDNNRRNRNLPGSDRNHHRQGPWPRRHHDRRHHHLPQITNNTTAARTPGATGSGASPRGAGLLIDARWRKRTAFERPVSTRAVSGDSCERHRRGFWVTLSGCRRRAIFDAG